MLTLLEGLKVVEVGSMLCADSAGMLLGDLGADVIKVENPAAPDSLRYVHGELSPGNSPAHLQFNRNKRSVLLDLRSPAGRSAFLELIAVADVFVDGSVGRSMARMGLGPDDLAATNPSLIHCQITGFGAEGPLAELPAHGLMMSAIVGAIPPIERPDSSLVPPGFPAFGGVVGAGSAPILSGMYGAFSILAALEQRRRTGKGAYLDVAASDAAVTGGAFSAANVLNEHSVTEWLGSESGSEFGESFGARYGYYRTKDGGTIFFGGIEGHLWERFLRACGREDLLRPHEPQLDYAEDDHVLAAELRALFLTRDRSDWVDLAREHRIPLGPVADSLPSSIGDAQLSTRALFAKAEHPATPEHWIVGPPVLVRGQEWSPGAPAPTPGQHDDELRNASGWPEPR